MSLGPNLDDRGKVDGLGTLDPYLDAKVSVSKGKSCVLSRLALSLELLEVNLTP